MKFLPSLLLALLCLQGSQASAAAPPNIVFILADDLRWNTLGCMGNTIIKTPNIDKLATQGVLFRNHFCTTSICCVSRASILSGQHERRHGIENFATAFTASQWAQTYPALLRAAGYRTGFIGKFGVGDAPAIAAMAKEFDDWHGLPGQGSVLFINPKDPTKTHETARMGGQALEFIEASDTTKPFCLSISFTAPHARDGQPREFQPDLRDESLYAEETIPKPPAATEEFYQKLPLFAQKSEGRKRWERRFATDEMYQRTMKDYYRLVTGIDREVGRMLEALEQRDLAKNTIMIFTSDNGWFAGDRGLADKWLMYEESIKLPLIVADPRLPESRRGTTCDAMTLNIDMAPTLLALAGVAAPATMQGRDLGPLLAGKTPEDWRTEFFYEHHFGPKIIPPSEGVRTTQWSYIHWLAPNPESEELYDVISDPLEATNLAAKPEYQKTLDELRGRWKHDQSSLK